MPQYNIEQMVTPPAPDRDKALKILAKSMFRELKAQGYESKHLVSLATELISLVTSDISGDSGR